MNNFKFEKPKVWALGPGALALVLMFLPPPLASARSFTSSLNLKVYEYGFGAHPDRYLGFTSAKADPAVSLPSTDFWYVRPMGRLGNEDLEVLAGEIKDKRVPGLDLSNRWDVTDGSLSAFEGLDALRLLLLTHTRVTDAGLARIEKLTGLKYLVLNNQTTDAGLRHLKDLKALEYLNLHRSRVGDAGLALLKNLPRLHMLDVGGTRVTSAGARTLGSLTSLRQLDISDTAITDNGLSLLGGLTQLQSLYTSQHITDAGMRYLATLKKLKVLDVSGSPVTNAGVAALSETPGLEELALSGTRVDDRALKHLARMKRLRTLELSFTEVTSDGLPSLADLPRLETLSLSWGKLTEADLRALGELRSLKTVILNGEVLPQDVFTRISSLAKAHAKARERKQTVSFEHYALPATPVPNAPSRGGNTSSQRLQNVNAPRSPKLDEPAMPGDLAPVVPVSKSIPLDNAPRGKPMEIEVSAKSRRRASSANALNGLKRIHQLEITSATQEPDLVPGETRQITSPKESPVNSLGEIEVYPRRQ